MTKWNFMSQLNIGNSSNNDFHLHGMYQVYVLVF